jgi:hypothetical protein
MTTEPVSLLHEFNENNASEKSNSGTKKKKPLPNGSGFLVSEWSNLNTPGFEQ